jgi:hypothetical protein
VRVLDLEGKNGFCLVRSISQLHGKKLAVAILSRQIAVFLAESNLSHLHRCANTTSCRLYFYDTTKNDGSGAAWRRAVIVTKLRSSVNGRQKSMDKIQVLFRKKKRRDVRRRTRSIGGLDPRSPCA